MRSSTSRSLVDRSGNRCWSKADSGRVRNASTRFATDAPKMASPPGRCGYLGQQVVGAGGLGPLTDLGQHRVGVAAARGKGVAGEGSTNQATPDGAPILSSVDMSFM